MQCLLDTNIFIKWINNDYSILSTEQLAILRNPSNNLFISTASIHEMAVKVRKGNLEMSMLFADAINHIVEKIPVLSTDAYFPDYQGLVVIS